MYEGAAENATEYVGGWLSFWVPGEGCAWPCPRDETELDGFSSVRWSSCASVLKLILNLDVSPSAALQSRNGSTSLQSSSSAVEVDGVRMPQLDHPALSVSGSEELLLRTGYEIRRESCRRRVCSRAGGGDASNTRARDDATRRSVWRCGKS